jgi:branched-chain amino acid transport system substrate-binding protein
LPTRPFNLKDFELGLLLPGIKINTSPTDHFPVEQTQVTQFNDKYCCLDT